MMGGRRKEIPEKAVTPEQKRVLWLAQNKPSWWALHWKRCETQRLMSQGGWPWEKKIYDPSY